MRSGLPKALHVLAGRTLLEHVLTSARQAGGSDIAVVVGPDHKAVEAQACAHTPKVRIFVQRERRGTAHAVLSAKAAIARGPDDILVIFSDTLLVQPETLPACASAGRGRDSGGSWISPGQSGRLRAID
jgi:bifunctional UDP-N-acetylglucosamine pyrophosphorylase/glucosamine-1-phosphate N-acetyltransferase